MAGRKSDFTLTTLDDLFSTQEQRDDEKLSKIRDIPLEEIDDFPDHPFQVREDEDMFQLVESIKERGVITPAIQRGDVAVSEGKTLRDYITDYLSKAKNDQIHRVAVALGLDEAKLRNIMSLQLNSSNINEFGRYDDLKKTVDKAKAKAYFEKVEGTKIIPPKVNVKVDNLLREFILNGGFEIETVDKDD